MSKADDIFIKQFGVIIGLLVVFAFLMYFLASGIGTVSHATSSNSPSAVAERIAPVGKVRVEGSEAAQEAAAEVQARAAEPVAATAAAGGQSGEEIYNTVCLACHATGAAGAPKMGDKAAWEARYALGLDALVNSSINGKGAMPPKGGSTSTSDDEIRAAVEYMLVQTGFEVSAAAAPAAATEAPATAAAETTESQATTESAPAAEAAAPTEVATADGQPGDEVYNLACIACHATGAANAPKVGDAAAWRSRVGQGMDTLVHNAVNGKNAMPAKGGMPNLTDADVRNAVGYMLEETGVTAE